MKEILKKFNEFEGFGKEREKNLDLFMKARGLKERYGLNIIVEPKEAFERWVPKKKSGFEIDASEGVVVKKLEGMEREKSELFEVVGESKFEHFNNAFFRDILVFEVGKDSKESVKMIFDLDKSPEIKKIAIFIGENSQVKIDLRKKSSEESYFGSKIVIFLSKNAKVDFSNLISCLGATGVHKIKVVQEEESEFKYGEFVINGEYVSSDVDVDLKAFGAKAEIKSFSLADEVEKHDLNSIMNHKSKNTKSSVLVRGVLGGESQVISRSLINMENQTEGSEGFEKQDFLMLSEGCEVDAIPNLEIGDNRVKCSHGSSIGKINKDKMFYLMSRGLKRSEASKEIIKGYFGDFLESDFDEEINSKIERVANGV